MSHEMNEYDRMFSVRLAPWHMGMGTNIATTEGLPTMGPDGEIPKDLAKTHGAMIIAEPSSRLVRPSRPRFRDWEFAASSSSRATTVPVRWFTSV